MKNQPTLVNVNVGSGLPDPSHVISSRSPTEITSPSGTDNSNFAMGRSRKIY